MRIDKILLLASLFIGALALSACPGPKWPKCENDDQCKADKKGNEAKADFVCVFGQCLECGKDGDCDSGERCTDGRCEETCKSKSDCPSGLECRAGDCKRAALKDGECRSAKDCDDDEACNREGTCIKRKVGANGGDAGAEKLICKDSETLPFEYNLYNLSPENREELDNFAKCMGQNKGWSMVVAGHADERGTTQYNLDLGEKRARSVKEYLSRLGVSGGRVRTVSYGEERPAIESSNESAWAKNRRVDIKIKK